MKRTRCIQWMTVVCMTVISGSTLTAQFSPLPWRWHATSSIELDDGTILASLWKSVIPTYAGRPMFPTGHVMLATIKQHAILDTLSYHGEFFTWPSGLTDASYGLGQLYRLSEDTLAWRITGTVAEVMPTWGVEVYTLSPLSKLDPQLQQFASFGSLSVMRESMEIICGWDSVAYGPDLESRVLGKGLFKQYQSQSGRTTWFVQYCSGMSHEIVTPSSFVQGLRFCDDTTIIAADSTTVYWTTNEGSTWDRASPSDLVPTSKILAKHRCADGTVVVLTSETDTMVAVHLKDPNAGPWQRFPLHRNRCFYGCGPFSIQGSTLANLIVSVDTTMYVWDPLLSTPHEKLPIQRAENIAVRRGQSIPVVNVDEDAVLMDLCGRTIGPLHPMNGTLPTADLEPGLYAMTVGARQRRMVLILP